MGQILRKQWVATAAVATFLGALATQLIGGGSGAAAETVGHVPPALATACAHLGHVTTSTYDRDSLPAGPGWPAGETFASYSAKDKVVVAVLSSTGVHFTPSAVPGGDYDICFVNELASKYKGQDVALDVEGSALQLNIGAVHAGTIGGVQLCPGNEWESVSVNDGLSRINVGPLSVSPSKGCGVPVT
jgi:hypothetical protein